MSLISREKLLAHFSWWPDTDENKGIFESIIACQPDVDAVPVVHGKWIQFEGETGVEAFGYKEYMTLGFKCSVCHADIDVSEQYFRYCPMCGSKMDGGADNE